MSPTKKTLQRSSWKHYFWHGAISALLSLCISTQTINVFRLKHAGLSVFLPFLRIFGAFWWRHMKTLHGYIFYHHFYTKEDITYPNMYTFHMIWYMRRCLFTPQSWQLRPKTRDNLLQNRWDKAPNPLVFLNLPPSPP